MDLESKIVVILGLESSGKSAVANGLHQENGGFPEYAPGAEKEPQGDSDHIRTKKFSSDLCIEIHDQPKVIENADEDEFFQGLMEYVGDLAPGFNAVLFCIDWTQPISETLMDTLVVFGALLEESIDKFRFVYTMLDKLPESEKTEENLMKKHNELVNALSQKECDVFKALPIFFDKKEKPRVADNGLQPVIDQLQGVLSQKIVLSSKITTEVVAFSQFKRLRISQSTTATAQIIQKEIDEKMAQLEVNCSWVTQTRNKMKIKLTPIKEEKVRSGQVNEKKEPVTQVLPKPEKAQPTKVSDRADPESMFFCLQAAVNATRNENLSAKKSIRSLVDKISNDIFVEASKDLGRLISGPLEANGFNAKAAVKNVPDFMHGVWWSAILKSAGLLQ